MQKNYSQNGLRSLYKAGKRLDKGALFTRIKAYYSLTKEE